METLNGLNAVSLFAGVGGFELALKGAGIEVAASVEIDEKARGVLARHFPETPLFSDVCEVTGNQLKDAGFRPDRGIIAGGFPCQDLSIAGKRAGLGGPHSKLFWEFERLVGETQPRWLVIENVPGLLSSNRGRDMGAVLGALVNRGYGVSWRVLDAQFFGVPQRRRRVVIVGHLGDDGEASSKVLSLEESLRGHPQPGDPKRAFLAASDGEGASGDNLAAALTAKLAKHSTGPSGYEVGNLVLVKSRRAQSQSDFEAWAPSEVAPALNGFDNTSDQRATILASGVRRFTPRECERLQGFPDDWTAERFHFQKQQLVRQLDSSRYRQMGNAIAVPVFEWVFRNIVDWENALWPKSSSPEI